MGSKSGKGENYPYRLLDLNVPNERKWLLKHGEMLSENKPHLCSDEKKLELRLGLPDDEEETEEKKRSRKNKTPIERDGFNHNHQSHHHHQSYSLAYIAASTSSVIHCDFRNNNDNNNANRYSCGQDHKQQRQISFPAAQWAGSGGYSKESSQPGGSRILAEDLAEKNKKGFSPARAAAKNTSIVANISQKRSAPAPVVGWPPIRSFRKNLASSSNRLAGAKPVSDPQNGILGSKPIGEKKPIEISNKCQFVKINMDGVPIGRKVDLSAFDSYEKLSSSVDDLFRELLAAQSDSSAGGVHEKPGEAKAITGLLDGDGEYTLVYEDDEGDRMLVGDVPWHMFVSNVKRLRVLKSTELPKLSRGNCKEGKLSNGSSPSAAR